jgi:hypothetical protein
MPRRHAPSCRFPRLVAPLVRLRAEPDRGSVSVWLATAGFAMIVLVGLAVDLSGQVYAQQHARDVAAQAARAGGQQLQAPVAIRGEGAIPNTAAAVAAARAYLEAADGVTGTAQVTGGNTITVATAATYRTKFLGIIGLSSLSVTGHARSRITRSVGGVEQ